MLGTLRTVVNQINGNPLNDGARAKAYWRFLRWQIASRVIKAPIAFDFIKGMRLLAKNGQAGATGNWYSGLNDVHEMSFLLHFLRPGDLFADIGANVGSYTVLAAGGCGAKVIAVEPVPTTFSDLTACVGVNDLHKRVALKRCGISDRAGVLWFSADRDTTNHIVSEGTSGAVAVDVFTLDEVLGGNVPRAIKIDVEGHEWAVLKGGNSFLSAADPAAVLMETNGLSSRSGVSNDDIVNVMKGFGFDPCIYDAFTRSLTRDKTGGKNTIFVKRFDEVQKLCSAGPTFTVNGVTI